jgi:hypothetical protein
VNNFPSPNGPSAVSTYLTEFDQLPEQNGIISPNPKIHHFCFNNTHLITVMESPTTKGASRMIVRDVSGVYCWEYKVVYKPDDSTFKYVGKGRRKTILDVEIPPEDLKKVEEMQNGEVTQKEGSQQEIKSEQDTVQEKSNEENANAVGEEEEKENAPVGEEDEQSEELEQDYPIFDPDIDTDKTDMMNLLSHYIVQVFPETGQFVDTAMTPIPELKIDTKELLDSAEKQIQSEQKLLKETPKRFVFLNMFNSK